MHVPFSQQGYLVAYKPIPCEDVQSNNSQELARRFSNENLRLCQQF